MLPVCSATTSSSCHVQIPVHGGLKSIIPYWRTSDFHSKNVEKIVLSFSNGVHLDTSSFKRQPVSCFYSTGTSNGSLYQSKLGNITQLTESNYQVEIFDKSHGLGSHGMVFVDNSSNSTGDDQLVDFIDQTIENTDKLPNYVVPESTTPSIGLPIDPPPVRESLNIDASSLSGQKMNLSDIVNRAEDVLNNSFDNVTSSLTKALTNANESVDNAINYIISFIDKTGESVGDKLTIFSSELKEASGKTGLVAVDVLRRSIFVFEDSLIQGGKTVGYAYSSAKDYLPPEFRKILSLSEESAVKVLTPVGTAFQQVYIALEGFEESIGLDPNDPLIPFVLLLGLSATLWGSYRVLKYSGYAGDLSPEETVELLRGNTNVALIDIRPENLRERDGIPDLRRAARFRYASVSLPEVDGSVKKLMKGGKDIEDSLLAAVIRNLKIVDDRSKVLVMDADGTRSKSIARSLRKLGIKRPYQVQGGFRSWVKEGFRVKELKPETTLTILNEEAEAILEEINPTPLKLIGYGVVRLYSRSSYSSLFFSRVGTNTAVHWCNWLRADYIPPSRLLPRCRRF
ncbi:hypothetical protein ACJIZ3_020431 [Penstemon smallii]|uniref:Rhodanese domain-containing protein n=1 Tax=Penstemon smallii TaxID=265156 RepID=A0ABD3SIL8_9LAMI